MVEDGLRFAICEYGNTLVVSENLTGSSIIWRGNHFEHYTIEYQSIITHLQNAQEMLLRQLPMRKKVKNSYCMCTDSFLLHESGNSRFKISYKNMWAIVTEEGITCSMNFKKNTLLNKLNCIYGIVASYNNLLSNKRTAKLRRLSEFGLLTIKCNGHIVVCREDNVLQHSLIACLYDNIYFPYLYVSVDMESNKFKLYTDSADLLEEADADENIIKYFGNNRKEP